ncbi:hypothetical protein [Chryseobacterium sp. BIGb0232]|uniref:hypothetical protein n=1 Tax=Chryseobacterium sp. BIGb0232 TaxID=2940598 RepID=UPI000F460874|nr:hypothetical protein [Chryseobacterium sp. BIGb0232]MCS4301010.1 hypothetical protein [Chryseobacterium sp. BIGb0232]ROS20124.1 hypothetical protein EDF65_0827 [Chryseobacterium nakagawai]
MRKNLYLIIILFSLTSCYTYQVKKPAAPVTDNKQESKKSSAPANNALMQTKSAIAEPQAQSLPSQQQPAAPASIQEKLAPNKNVKIDVDGKSYKVIVDRWESDSLVAHPVHNAKKTLKFHKNQINADKIAEKRFSQPIADIITVTAYAGIAAAIWYLVR